MVAEIAENNVYGVSYGYFLAILNNDDTNTTTPEYIRNTLVDGDEMYGHACEVTFPRRCLVGGLWDKYKAYNDGWSGSRSIICNQGTCVVLSGISQEMNRGRDC